jgi:uncharacterized metal-binding protein
MNQNHERSWHDFSVVCKVGTQAKGSLCSLFQVSSEGTRVCNGRVGARVARDSHKFH